MPGCQFDESCGRHYYAEYEVTITEETDNGTETWVQNYCGFHTGMTEKFYRGKSNATMSMKPIER